MAKNKIAKKLAAKKIIAKTTVKKVVKKPSPKQKKNAKRNKKKKSPAKKVIQKGRGISSTKNRKPKNSKSKVSKKTKKSSNKTIRVSKAVTSSTKSGKRLTTSKRAKKATGRKERKPKAKKQSGKIVYSKRRGNKQLDFTFSGVKKLDKKKGLFKSSKEVDRTISRMILLKGKPPRGVVVIIGGKKINSDGTKEKAHRTVVSPLDFVVNKENTIAFVDGILDKMEIDYEEWIDMEGEPDDGNGDVDSYGTFEPDTVNEISLKFIY
jgi:hypothetical protein